MQEEEDLAGSGIGATPELAAPAGRRLNNRCAAFERQIQRVVIAAAVDDDDLVARLFAVQAAQQSRQVRRLVEGRDDDRNLRTRLSRKLGSGFSALHRYPRSIRS